MVVGLTLATPQGTVELGTAPRSAAGPDLRQLVLGSDFTSVGAPPPAGAPVSLQVERNKTSAPTKLPEDLSVTNAADTHCE